MSKPFGHEASGGRGRWQAHEHKRQRRRERWERYRHEAGTDPAHLHRLRHRLHRRWHHERTRFSHSLRARLIAVFLLLALASCAIFYGAQSHAYDPWWALPMLLGVTGLAYGAIQKLLRPLRAIALGAEAFGRGELDHRIRLRRHDELAQVAQRFNAMAEQIQAMLDGKRALLLAISHELRSPLTRARLHAELLDEGPGRSALLGDLAQMRELINVLLENERLGAGHSALQRQACTLSALLDEFRALPGVEVDDDPGLPSLMLDPMRMQLLLRNLLANAQRHHDATRGPVRLIARRQDGGVLLFVQDHGPGVPSEALAQLGQPFFRPDAARSRDQGGVGLGLSLCRLIAIAHGGRLLLRNRPPADGGGFEAGVWLPIAEA